LFACALVCTTIGTLSATTLCAQSEGPAMYVSGLGSLSLDKSTRTPNAVFGAGGILPLGDGHALAFGFATQQAGLGSGLPTVGVLELTAELRQRIWSASPPGHSAAYLFIGGGLSRASLGADTHSGVIGSGGLAVAWPFADALGVEFRLAGTYERHPARFLGLPGDSMPAVAAVTSIGHVGLRAGLAFFLKPVSKPRRIPVSAMPDATETPRPVSSFQGMLLHRDSVIAAARAGGDDRLMADPDARSGAAVAAPYLTPHIVYDTIARAELAADKPGRGRGRNPAKAAKVRTDTILALADPRAAQTAVVAHQTPAPPPPVIVPRPVVAVAPSGYPSTTPSVENAPALPRALPDPPVHVVAPVIADTIDTTVDSSGTTLAIRPALIAGELAHGTVDRLLTFAESMRNEGVTLTYQFVVESAPSDDEGTVRLLDNGYAAKQRLLSVGIPAARVLVVERPAPRAMTSRMRIVVRGLPTNAPHPPE